MSRLFAMFVSSLGHVVMVIDLKQALRSCQQVLDADKGEQCVCRNSESRARMQKKRSPPSEPSKRTFVFDCKRKGADPKAPLPSTMQPKLKSTNTISTRPTLTTTILATRNRTTTKKHNDDHADDDEKNTTMTRNPNYNDNNDNNIHDDDDDASDDANDDLLVFHEFYLYRARCTRQRQAPRQRKVSF